MTIAVIALCFMTLLAAGFALAFVLEVKQDLENVRFDIEKKYAHLLERNKETADGNLKTHEIIRDIIDLDERIIEFNDELSEDNYLNQILKTTIFVILKSDNLRPFLILGEIEKTKKEINNERISN